MSFPLSYYLSALEQIVSVAGDPDLPVAGATVDSRQVRPGYLFCAVPGVKDDGAKYVALAVAAGAVAVVSEKPLALPPGVASVLVPNATHAAADLAAAMHGFPASRMRLLGVTGTNGKTTTAFLMRHLLEKAGLVAGMVGTVHYSYGQTVIEADRTTPPAFAVQELFAKMVAAGVHTCMLEMSSHALDQRRLGRCRFAAAVFTNLTGDHLDYHGTMEKYYQAKKLMFTEYLVPGGIAVVNAGSEYGRRLCGELRRERPDLQLMDFSLHGDAAWDIREVKFELHGGEFLLQGPGRTLRIQSPLIGWHNAENLAGTALLALGLGLPESLILNGLRETGGAPGRLQPVLSSKGFAAYVDYAHTDDALRNVLEALRKLTPARLTCLFGCGGDRDTTKRPRMAKVAAELADKVIVTSDNPRTEDPEKILDMVAAGIPAGLPFLRIADRRLAIARAVGEAIPGEIILVAGKGHESYQEIHGVKHPFDDAEEVRAAMEKA